MTDLQTPASVWSDVAAAWDANVDYIDDHSAVSTATLLDQLDIGAGERVLELAAGPGTLGPTLAARVGPTGSVLISDIAPGMVEVARRRNASLSNVTCDVIDASDIDRRDGAFDIVISRMGLMFTPEPLRAFGEIRRVLAPGGRIGAMTWAGIEHNPWMTCVGMAAMMAGIATDGPPVGPGAIFSLADPAHVEALLRDAGFADVSVDVDDVVFQASDIDTHVTRVSALAGPLSGRLAGATPDQQAALRRTAADLAAPHATADGYAFPGRMLRITARQVT